MRSSSVGTATRARRAPHLGAAVCVALIAMCAAGCPRATGGGGDTKRSTTRLDLAKDYLARGQLEASEGEARKALEFDGENVEAHNVLGLVEYLRAVRNFNLLEVDDCLTGRDAEALRQQIDEHLALADKQFARAVEIDEEYGEAWANRGLVAFHLEAYATSARYLEKALTFPQRLVNIGLARAHLGWAYFHEKDMPRAATELRQAEQFNRGMCVAKYRLGRVYFARKEWNKALEQFQAIDADRSCPMQEAQLYLLETYRALRMRDPLAGTQKRCIDMAPRSCVAAQCRALL